MSRVPAFGVGECDSVIDYAGPAVARLCARLGLSDNVDRVQAAFMAALRANAATMQRSLGSSYVPYVPESRRLLTLIESLLIRDTDVWGYPSMQAAQRIMARGGNVLLVSNHTSGADTLVLDYELRSYLIRRVMGAIAELAPNDTVRGPHAAGKR